MGMCLLAYSHLKPNLFSLLLCNGYEQAKPILDDGKYSQLLDQSLKDNNNGDQMQRMALAATLCIRRSPQARPKMSIVSHLFYLS